MDKIRETITGEIEVYHSITSKRTGKRLEYFGRVA